jgi:SAM-dependent methyltransferase
MVTPGTRVLDVGCGDGTLLRLLAEKRGVDGRGIELSQAGVNSCVAQGLAGDPGRRRHRPRLLPRPCLRLRDPVPDIQATYSPRDVLKQLLRIGRRAVVSFPNFGHWRVRAGLMFNGKMPTTDNLPDRWYDTPNIHLCTIKDFLDLCKDVGAKVERAHALNAYGSKMGVSMPLFMQNLFGEQLSSCCRDRVSLRSLLGPVLARYRAFKDRADEALIRNLLFLRLALSQHRAMI